MSRCLGYLGTLWLSDVKVLNRGVLAVPDDCERLSSPYLDGISSTGKSHLVRITGPSMPRTLVACSPCSANSDTTFSYLAFHLSSLLAQVPCRSVGDTEIPAHHQRSHYLISKRHSSSFRKQFLLQDCLINACFPCQNCSACSSVDLASNVPFGRTGSRRFQPIRMPAPV